MTASFSAARPLLAILFFLTWTAVPGWAQDTRGGVIPDGQVTLADGTTVDVQDLKTGAVLWSWGTGGAGTTKVTNIRRQHSDSFLLVKVGDRELQATGSHRVALAGGKLVRLETVKIGDKLWIGGPKGPQEAVVTSTRVFPSTLITYDLSVEGHGLFLLDGVVVAD
jgi:hypothetical protein